MSVVGIVAEFNPFHTGHKYIIDYAKKKLFADSVVIALGNEFTQRGGICVIDRYTRSECTIHAGADLVVGMPASASCSSAEIFAECGVCLLNACGCNALVCGYEGGDLKLLTQIASVLLEEPAAYRTELKRLLGSGKSFPAAREAALKEYMSYEYSEKIHELLSTPNTILAIEYQKAIIKHGFDMELIPVKRQGADYNDLSDNSEYVSASYIRSVLYNGRLPEIKKHLTPFSYRALTYASSKKLILKDRDISLPLHLALLSHHNYSDFNDVSEDLSCRIKRMLPRYTDFESFAELLKNRSLTASRIRRSLIHILLGIKDSDISDLRNRGFVPYIWVLSASMTGLSQLSQIKGSTDRPLFMSVNELKKDLPESLGKDLSALDLSRAIRIDRSGLALPDERQRRIDFRATCGKVHDL